MSYDAFAETFSNSRKHLHWPELDYIIADMIDHGSMSVLDIGCGNGRFIAQIQNSKFKIQNYLGIDSSKGMIDEAKKLHPENHFEIYSMESLASDPTILLSNYSAILFLASYHHLETREDRIQVLKESKKLLSQNGRIYMTNWNLRDQEKYTQNHRGDGDFDIKIGEFSRYYHGFTLDELAGLFDETGYTIIENRIFEGGRNFMSILSIG